MKRRDSRSTGGRPWPATPRRFAAAVVLTAVALVANVLIVRGVRDRFRAGPIIEDAPIAFRDVVAGAGIALGPDDAPVSVWIFGDYECPACERLERLAGTRLRLLAERGDLRLVYVQSPLLTREHGRLAGTASYCAARQGDPWPLHAQLYAQAREWSGAVDPAAAIVDLADSVRLERETFASCLRDAQVARAVDRDVAAAQRLGIDRVPTLIVDDQRVRLRRSPSELLDIVEARIRERRASGI